MRKDLNRDNNPDFTEAEEQGRKYIKRLLFISGAFTVATGFEAAGGHEAAAGLTIGAGVIAVGGLGFWLGRRNGDSFASAERNANMLATHKDRAPDSTILQFPQGSDIPDRPDQGA